MGIDEPADLAPNGEPWKRIQLPEQNASQVRFGLRQRRAKRPGWVAARYVRLQEQ